jgi:hypothetical protein
MGVVPVGKNLVGRHDRTPALIGHSGVLPKRCPESRGLPFQPACCADMKRPTGPRSIYRKKDAQGSDDARFARVSAIYG